MSEPASQPVGQAADATATAHGGPGVDAEDNVDPVTAQPSPLVETVPGGTRCGELSERVQDRSLRRRTAWRQTEQHRLVRPQLAETQHAPFGADVEATAARRRRHDDADTFGGPDARRERTAVQRLEPGPTPPPADEQKSEHNAPQAPLAECGRDKRRCGKHEQQRTAAHRVRERKTHADSEGDRVRGTVCECGHGATSSFSCSSRAGPIPGTASSSSTDPNAPCCCR